MAEKRKTVGKLAFVRQVKLHYDSIGCRMWSCS